jgi:hypothetical protein
MGRETGNSMKQSSRYHVALVYNAGSSALPEKPEDTGSTDDLRKMIRRMAHVLRKVGYKVTIVPLANDLLAAAS